MSLCTQFVRNITAQPCQVWKTNIHLLLFKIECLVKMTIFLIQTNKFSLPSKIALYKISLYTDTAVSVLWSGTARDAPAYLPL